MIFGRLGSIASCDAALIMQFPVSAEGKKSDEGEEMELAFEK